MRAAAELGIRTVAIHSREDRFSLHRTKADESYLVGDGKGPIDAYLDIADIIRVATEARVDAIHPGYGFLSESPEFAEACAAARNLFVGPLPDTMRRLGNKVEARNLAASAGVAVMPATPPLPDDARDCSRWPAPWAFRSCSRRVGAAAAAACASSRTTATSSRRWPPRAAKPRPRSARTRCISRSSSGARGTWRCRSSAIRTAISCILYERDCTVQRRNQKVVERAPAAFLSDARAQRALRGGPQDRARGGYRAAGTVEFLQDADTGKFYFIEVNPRIQVEHTVTECVTGIDLVKAQIRIAAGARIGTPESGVPLQEDIRVNAHALQCRVTTEDPENNFVPDYGRVTAYRSPAGFGIRLDAGTAYAGAIITRFYDSLLVKVTAWSPTPEETIARMHRALWEFRIRGVVTNLRFLDQLIMHPRFATADYTTKFIDQKRRSCSIFRASAIERRGC
jgi:pyruvate carboxylase